jgi:hypothetical protein
MSPYETGDISVEPERVATSGCDFIEREGGSGVCRRRRTARPNAFGISSGLKSRYRLGRGGGKVTHQPATGSAITPSARSRRARILQLARTRYAGFNDHHLCEKLCEAEGFFSGPRDPPRSVASFTAIPNSATPVVAQRGDILRGYNSRYFAEGAGKPACRTQSSQTRSCASGERLRAALSFTSSAERYCTSPRAWLWMRTSALTCR